MKIKWEVSPVPTGQYRSFEHRQWPVAVDENENTLFKIGCDDDYIPARVKTGNHAPLHIFVAYRADKINGFVWRKLNRTFLNLKEAKEAAAKFTEKHPEVFVNMT